jgi:hypothetical protein
LFFNFYLKIGRKIIKALQKPLRVEREKKAENENSHFCFYLYFFLCLKRLLLPLKFGCWFPVLTNAITRLLLTDANELGFMSLASITIYLAMKSIYNGKKVNSLL